jgi:hypothetical protein
MPRFKILATDRSYASAEITARDAGGILHIVGQLDCTAADVLQDDIYSFSVRLNRSGMWTIFQSDCHPAPQGVPAFG